MGAGSDPISRASRRQAQPASPACSRRRRGAAQAWTSTYCSAS